MIFHNGEKKVNQVHIINEQEVSFKKSRLREYLIDSSGHFT